MAITDTQYERLLARLTALEENHNNIAIAIDKFTTLDQLQELMVLIQTAVDEVQITLGALENRVQALEEEPLD